MSAAAEPDRQAVAAFWNPFCAATGAEGEPVDVFSFGDSALMADELADLVLAGTERATAAPMVDHAEEGFCRRSGTSRWSCGATGRRPRCSATQGAGRAPEQRGRRVRVGRGRG